MFGALVDDEGGWARLAERRVVGVGRFRDVDWGALVTAGAALTASLVNLGVKASQQNSQVNTGQTFSCPPGYIWDPTSATCVSTTYQPQGGGGGGGNFLSNIDPTTLAVIGVLAFVALSGKD